MFIEALTIDEDRFEIDEESRLQSPNEICDICRSFVRETKHPYPYLGPNPVEMFLQRGVDVNKCIPGREKWCPLIAAVQVSYSSSADELVSLLSRAALNFRF
ncbi:hypothetical protein FSPOR_8978 [Fusarium sporotrichioides]|uniref:Uncharacterized protein n=1 Tax=Fusarium sporotrichioides TaxID=5514 RepID=A0A395RSK4_FUSSP|nr:hypothetical protein FSPOR_8978 [Fusarium sporotrichioides]